MKKITIKEFEELIAKDEVLAAKAQVFIGEEGGNMEKTKAFAKSLGYEPETDDDLRAVSDDEVDDIAGGANGNAKDICKKEGHDWELIKKEKSWNGGTIAYYKCRRCNESKMKQELF